MRKLIAMFGIILCLDNININVKAMSNNNIKWYSMSILNSWISF